MTAEVDAYKEQEAYGEVSDLLETAYGQLPLKQHCVLTEIKTVTLHCLSQIRKSLTDPCGSMSQSDLRKAPMEAPGQVMVGVGTTAAANDNIIKLSLHRVH